MPTTCESGVRTLSHFRITPSAELASLPVVPMSSSAAVVAATLTSGVAGGPYSRGSARGAAGGRGEVRRVHRDECGHHLLQYLCPSGDEDNWDESLLLACMSVY
jgi:hypothetical protein